MGQPEKSVSVYLYGFAKKRTTPCRTPLRRCGRGLFSDIFSGTGEQVVRHRGTARPAPGNKAFPGAGRRSTDGERQGVNIFSKGIKSSGPIIRTHTQVTRTAGWCPISKERNARRQSTQGCYIPTPPLHFWFFEFGLL